MTGKAMQWKLGRKTTIAIVSAALLAVLLGVNMWAIDGETESATITVPGGRIISVDEHELQVVDKGSRDASPIVLIHCFTCAIDWWDAMVPLLERKHRVIAIDLLGHGGSEKPASGYSMPNQADLVAAVLERLGVQNATVVGHSLGGIVATALSESWPDLVNGVVIIGQAPTNDGYGAELPFSARLTFTPVVGEALWRVMPNSAIEDGLGVAFAPDYDVPSEFVDDFRRLTYTSYDDSPEAENTYTDAVSLDVRLSRAGVPVLAIFGAEEQIYDSREALAAYAALPGARTALLPRAGHSPNVEQPAATAALVEGFAASTEARAHPARERAAPEGGPREKPAATYSPRRLPSKYHRR